MMLRLVALVFFLNLISSLGFAQRFSNLENEKMTKGEHLDLEKDAIQESPSLLGELRFSDE